MAGALLPQDTQPRTRMHPQWRPVDSVLPLEEKDYLERTGTTAADVQALAPVVPTELATEVEQASGDLDADLAAWWDPRCPLPRLTLLGPVDLRVAGDGQEPQKRRAWLIEAVAYLSSREHGATVEECADALWWGQAEVPRARVRRTMDDVRSWLGTNPRSGRPHLPNALEAGQRRGVGVYQVEDVLVDAGLFKRLRTRGLARAQAGNGIADLRAALDLVSGAPFDQRRPGGYSWLAESHPDHTYQSMIVDVAHVVTTQLLAENKLDQARSAAQASLLARDRGDVALIDLTMICEAEGNLAQRDEHLRSILANHNAEVAEDLPPRTYEIFSRHGWDRYLSAAS